MSTGYLNANRKIQIGYIFDFSPLKLFFFLSLSFPYMQTRSKARWRIYTGRDKSQIWNESSIENGLVDRAPFQTMQKRDLDK